MFGHEAKPCKVYEYGCLPPISGEQILIDELHRRQRFWNALVEIERSVRAQVRELLAVPDDPVAPLADQLKAVREGIKTARKKARSGKVDVSMLQSRAAELRERIAAAKVERDASKKLVAEANRTVLDQLERERRAAVKAEIAKSGLYWCNYDEVQKDYEQARKKAMRDKTELKFHRWDGAGKVTVRYQKGLPVPDVFGSDTRLQINPVSAEVWESPSRSVRRRQARTVIRLRVTSDQNKKPVWVELPMVMHRPMPAESKIRCASIVRERVGRTWRYKAVITATIPENSIRRQIRGSGAVGVDLGWRMVKEGLRVAYWADDRGRHGELTLPPEVLHEFAKCDDLRAIRDKHFNEAKAALGKWLTENNGNAPEWLKDETKNLTQWRAAGKLANVVRRWRQARFDGDAEIFGQMSAWMHRENHLYDWEANLRDQVHRRRREIYRVFAAKLARSYATVVMEDFDLRKVARKPDPEQGTQRVLPTDRQRFVASVSELRLAIKNACQQAGTEYVATEAAYTTIDCAVCGHREKFDASAQVLHTCPKCGKLYDQDHNAAINLLQRVLRKSEVV